MMDAIMTRKVQEMHKSRLTFKLVISPLGPMTELARMVLKATAETKVRIKATANIISILNYNNFMKVLKAKNTPKIGHLA